MLARLTQLVVSCVVLGVGVGLLLATALGSDGYSTLINGLSLSLDVPFLAVNLVLGVALVAMARVRGVTPGPGTVVQPAVVGVTVSVVLAAVDEPHPLLGRLALLVVAFVVLAVGVAGYLGSATGPGTVLVVVGLGPVVDLVARLVPAVGRPAPRER